MRHREIVIDRTCARCGCSYEWGVHAAFFAERVGLTPEQQRGTVHGDANDPVWSKEEVLLIRLVDEFTIWQTFQIPYGTISQPHSASSRFSK